MNTSHTKRNVVIGLVVLAVIVVAGYLFAYPKGNTCWPYCPDMTDEDRAEILEQMKNASSTVENVSNAQIKSGLSLISPKVGETWKIGSKQTIAWNVNNVVVKNEYRIGIYLNNYMVGRLEANSSNSYVINDLGATVFSGDVGSALTPGKYDLVVKLFDGPIDLGNGNPNTRWGKVIYQATTPITITN